MEGLEDYKGREQAFVKHRLLEAYLKRLFMIVGQFQSSICYVDCFAGPWEESRDDLMDTSIGISMKIITECREALLRMGKDVRFRALYIEKRKRAHAKLQTFLRTNTTKDIAAEAFCGEFYDLRQAALDWCGPEDFAFFFIDPKGYKDVIPSTLCPLVRRGKSEFLINFMYEHLTRFLTLDSLSPYVSDIFGETPDVGKLSPKDKEEYLLGRYRSRLKECMQTEDGVPRSVCVPILDPARDRTKYELVYLTRSAKGIEVFMDASDRLDLVQRKVRARTKQEREEGKTGQPSLFGAEELLAEKDDRIDQEVVKNYWIKKLATEPQCFGIVQLADMLEETGWFESDLQKAFGELLAEGKVANLDMERKRRSRFVHFDENRNQGERLRKLST